MEQVSCSMMTGIIMGNDQKRELPVLFGQKRMYPKNKSGRECCWPYLIGQHPLSPVFGQKRPGTPGNSYFAQLPPVFGHLMFRFWPFYVAFRWATQLLEPINMDHKTRTINNILSFFCNNFGAISPVCLGDTQKFYYTSPNHNLYVTCRQRDAA